MSEGPQELPFQGESLVITNHAVERFKQRWCEFNPEPLKESRVLRTLGRLLASAKPDEVPPGYKVERILNNNFQNAEYWGNSGWRFVIVRENKIPILTTVERAYPPRCR